MRFEDFDTSPDRGCRMNDPARRAFLAAYERRMLALFTHKGSARRVSYRVGLALQAQSARPRGARFCNRLPADQVEMTMMYLVCYDIADDARRDDVATVLFRPAGPAQCFRVCGSVPYGCS
ncbi:hypothetical protein J5X84_42955 [Streptosporangiaceae bacterium NEAU-GS5]|nr:hypothetical protein [Streptosporangiaceae bacterium NEAU-GS5]